MNCFLPSQTNLSVVILAAIILFEVIVLLQKILAKNNRVRGSSAGFLAMKHERYPKWCYSQGVL